MVNPHKQARIFFGGKNPKSNRFTILFSALLTDLSDRCDRVAVESLKNRKLDMLIMIQGSGANLLHVGKNGDVNQACNVLRKGRSREIKKKSAAR